LGGVGVIVAQNIELKRYCPDFLPVRRMLRQMGAKHVVTKRQIDTFLCLPEGRERRFKRMKVREEQRRTRLIAYSDSYADGLRDVDYRVSEINRPMKDLLIGALGVSAVVTKKRELWMLGTTRFHLDTVEGVGRVFEVEVVLKPGEKPDDTQRYLRLFDPYLGDKVDASNVDLVGG
jgi:adenylate cyclase class IV